MQDFPLHGVYIETLSTNNIEMKTMKLWRKVLLQALFYFCSFMAIIWLLNMVFSDGIDDWKGEIIKGSLYTVTIIIFNNWKEIKENI